MMKLSGFDTYLDLKKQRYKCRHCDRTFTLKTSLVESNCYLSNPLKQAIFLEASHKKSESDIARELNVSHSTVNRIIHTSYEEQPLSLIHILICMHSYVELVRIRFLHHAIEVHG